MSNRSRASCVCDRTAHTNSAPPALTLTQAMSGRWRSARPRSSVASGWQRMRTIQSLSPSARGSTVAITCSTPERCNAR
jgi:hypothetical protein